MTDNQAPFQSDYSAKDINTSFLIDKANTLYKQGRFIEMLALLDSSAPEAINNVELLNVAGISALSCGELSKSEFFLRQALAINPNAFEVHSNLGTLLEELKRFADAEASFRQAISLQPDYAYAHSNLGVLLRKMKRFTEAELCYRTALSINIELPDTHNNLGMLLLSLGRFSEGWQRHEQRYHPAIGNSNSLAPFYLPFPPWRGQSLQGKSIVLFPEQGYGDQIQFCRYTAELKRLGASKITLVCDRFLKDLFSTLANVDVLVEREQVAYLKAHDYWSLLLSLPLHCNTTLDNIPTPLPYLSAPAERIGKWSKLLQVSGLRVGLVWKGSKTHKNDNNRSLPDLQTLAPLWRVPGITFISLQKGQGENEVTSALAEYSILTFGSQIRDFADTAAIVSQLDLVICVDTAIAHLVGALNKPCWVLLPALGTDWRWLLERSDTPWYPNVMRLFRQQSDGDWGALISDVALALEDWRLSNASHGKKAYYRKGIVWKLISSLGLARDS